MNVQVIEKDGQPEWAVIPYKAYQHLVEQAEMLQDIQDYDEAKQAIANGEELIPAEVTYAILDGENPIKVWREYRGLTLQQLADKIGINELHLTQLESKQLEEATKTIEAIAETLQITLEDLSIFT